MSFINWPAVMCEAQEAASIAIAGVLERHRVERYRVRVRLERETVATPVVEACASIEAEAPEDPSAARFALLELE